MTRALAETNGHYSQFTGDGLMALYGLEGDPQRGAADALRGAREMLRRLEEVLNRQMKGEIEPLHIGIGIHHHEAVVGTRAAELADHHRDRRHREYLRAARKPDQGVQLLDRRIA